jgi:hypothetical protein
MHQLWYQSKLCTLQIGHTILNFASVLVGTVHGAISGYIKECFIEVWDKMDKKYVWYGPFLLVKFCW